MQRKSTSNSALISSRALIVLLFFATTICFVVIPAKSGLPVIHPEKPATISNRTLTFEERVSYQRAIEEVYWRHRIWPKENASPKPPVDVVMSQTQLERKVTDYLRNSQVLEDYWQRAITDKQLQAEMDRMAQQTKQPEALQELFVALGNDAFVIAECLARPILAQRLLDAYFTDDEAKQTSQISDQIAVLGGRYNLPVIVQAAGGCDDIWTQTSQ
jgi:hypothetical protein